MKKIILISLFVPFILSAKEKRDSAQFSFTVKPVIGIGFVRNQFTPTFDLSLRFKYKKHQLNLGTSSNLFFDNANINKASVYTFLGLEFRESDYIGGGVAVLTNPWFQSSWDGKQFAKNTWKIYSYMQISKNIELAPEIIFTGIYVYPGVTIKF